MERQDNQEGMLTACLKACSHWPEHSSKQRMRSAFAFCSLMSLMTSPGHIQVQEELEASALDTFAISHFISLRVFCNMPP